MSSVRQIAKEAGVSITTVSRALNNDAAVSAKTRELVLAVANRTGYAASVGKRVTTNIGLVYAGEQTLSHPYDAGVLAGAARGVEECRFDLVILNMKRDKRPDETYTQFFMRKGVRGALVRVMADTREIARDIAHEGFPTVVLSDRFDDPTVNFIDGDSAAESARAVDYLYSLGHRRIAFGMHNVDDSDHLDRLDGYRQSLLKNGLRCCDELVFRQPYTLAGGATIMKLATSMPDRPTAIYFADPHLAVGAMKMAQQIGVRIPDDISIVGFDDGEIRFSVHPTMTAVCQNAAALGFEAAAYLTRALRNGTNTSFRKSVPTYLEIHQSCGPPPKPNGAADATVQRVPVSGS